METVLHCLLNNMDSCHSRLLCYCIMGENKLPLLVNIISNGPNCTWKHLFWPQVPPSGWKCEQCDKTDNLWLNLTDGKILCGRRQLDGSGGNNHALEHYEKTSECSDICI